MDMDKILTKRNKKKLAQLITALIITIVGFYWQAAEAPVNSLDISQAGMYKVVSIADGDTITVDMEGKKEKIRFIGVDTPEIHHGGSTAPTECYGDLATNFTTELIAGQRVKLVADSKGSNRDRYGRLLRYVYNFEDKPIDQLLVSEGYGFAVSGFAYSKKEQYLELMDQAEAADRGLWAKCEIDYSKGYPEVKS